MCSNNIDVIFTVDRGELITADTTPSCGWWAGLTTGVFSVLIGAVIAILAVAP